MKDMIKEGDSIYSIQLANLFNNGKEKPKPPKTPKSAAEKAAAEKAAAEKAAAEKAAVANVFEIVQLQY